jgi:hypothetical protein
MERPKLYLPYSEQAIATCRNVSRIASWQAQSTLIPDAVPTVNRFHRSLVPK